jgi:hypothetical protein
LELLPHGLRRPPATGEDPREEREAAAEWQLKRLPLRRDGMSTVGTCVERVYPAFPDPHGVLRYRSP